MSELFNAESVLEAVQEWADEHPDAWIELVKEQFDQDGQQKATKAVPAEVEKVGVRDNKLLIRLKAKVDYKNPVDEGDTELAASNVTDHTFDVEASLEELSVVLDDLQIALGDTFP